MDKSSRAFDLRLYVAGQSLQSRKSIEDLDHLVEAHGQDRTQITVIDLFEEPDEAIERDILAIPTLIRESPPPKVRIIGDLSNGERVWTMLTA